MLVMRARPPGRSGAVVWAAREDDPAETEPCVNPAIGCEAAPLRGAGPVDTALPNGRDIVVMRSEPPEEGEDTEPRVELASGCAADSGRRLCAWPAGAALHIREDAVERSAAEHDKADDKPCVERVPSCATSGLRMWPCAGACPVDAAALQLCICAGSDSAARF